MRLSDRTFLNRGNGSSTSHEVAGGYLGEEIWGNVNLYKNIIGRMGVRNSSVTKKAGTVDSPKLIFCWSPHIVSLCLSVSYHSYEKTWINAIIMQASVKYAFKPEKWHNMQCKSLYIYICY